MTVAHNHPHPLAQKVVEPSNAEILKKFGTVRVEDWNDRVTGLLWTEIAQRGNYSEVSEYPISALAAQKGRGPVSATHDVVRCHSVTTGEVVLLHNDWLPSDQDVPHSG